MKAKTFLIVAILVSNVTFSVAAVYVQETLDNDTQKNDMHLPHQPLLDTLKDDEKMGILPSKTLLCLY